MEDEYNFSMSEMTEAKEELRKNSPKDRKEKQRNRKVMEYDFWYDSRTAYQ